VNLGHLDKIFFLVPGGAALILLSMTFTINAY
jgi:hypothetical protein